MRRIKLFIYVGTIFTSGIALGVALSGYFVTQQLPSLLSDAGKFSDLVMFRLDRELSLSDAQDKQTRTVLADMIRSVWSAETPCRTARRSVVDSSVSKIMGGLNDEQKTKFAQLVGDFQKQREAWDQANDKMSLQKD